MTRLPIVRTELRIARRSRALPVVLLAVLGTALLNAAGIVPATDPGAASATTTDIYFHHHPDSGTVPIYIQTLASPGLPLLSLSWVVPLAGLLFGAGAIVDDRRTGRIRTALSTPCSRSRLYLETVLGRSIAFGSVLVVTLGVVAVVVLVREGFVPGPSYLWFVASTVLYACTFVGIGAFLSTLSTSKRRVVVAAVGVYLLFTPIGWRAAAAVVPLDSSVHSALEPTTAYAILASAGYDGFEATSRVSAAGLRVASPEAITHWSSIPDRTPSYLGAPAAMLTLVLWWGLSAIAGGFTLNEADLQ